MKELKTFKKLVTIGNSYDHVTGKRFQKRITIRVEAKNQREADKLIAVQQALEIAKYKQINGCKSVDTMDDLVKMYDERIDRKVTTRCTDYSLWSPQKPELGLKKFWGKMKINKIDDKLFVEFINEARENGWSKHKIHCAYNFFSKHLTFAVVQGIIQYNPFERLKRSECAKVPAPNPVDGELIKADINKFYGKIFYEKDTFSLVKFKLMLLLSADAALREAELFGLSETSVDIEKRIVRIERNYYQIPKGAASGIGVESNGFSTTKTKGSTRRLPISELTAIYTKLYLKMSRNYRSKNKLTNSKGYLFYSVRNMPDRIGYDSRRAKNAPVIDVLPPTKRGFNSSISRWCTKYGLSSFTSHKIRKWTNDVRRVDLAIPKEERDYVLGHSEKAVDAAYNLVDMYYRVEKSHKKWEEYLNGVIGFDADFSKRLSNELSKRA